MALGKNFVDDGPNISGMLKGPKGGLTLLGGRDLCERRKRNGLQPCRSFVQPKWHTPPQNARGLGQPTFQLPALYAPLSENGRIIVRKFPSCCPAPHLSDWMVDLTYCGATFIAWST